MDRSFDERLKTFVGRPIVRWGGLAVGIVMFGFVVARSWSGLSEAQDAQVDWLWIAVSLLLICLGEGVTGIGLARAISMLGQPAGIRTGIHVHFATAPARVLPGFLGTTVGRVGVGARHGLASKQVAAASLIEPSMSAVVAVALGLAFIDEPLVAVGGDLEPAWRLALISLVVVVVVLVVLATLRYFRRTVRGRSVKFHQWALLLLTYLVVWVLFGASLSALIEGVGGGYLGIGQSAAIFAVSWLLGFVVIVVPGGLGIRESVMVLLLTPWISPELGATVAVISRLLWWIATGVVFALSSLARSPEVEGSQ